MMEHLLAVQQIRARLTQVAQVYLPKKREKTWMTDGTGGRCAAPSADCVAT